MKMPIRIAPIPETFLESVRSRGRDDLGQPVRRVVARGGEPCRDVLRRATAGENLILASFSPFSAEGPYKEYGPIFVLASQTAETVERETLPVRPSNGISPESYLRSQFVLRAYSKEETILAAEMVTPEGADSTVEKLLGSPDVAFVHARFSLFGCFACRIDRS
jgi:hypothetical protein